MSKPKPTQVAQILGFSATQNGEMALIGVKTTTGQQLDLGLTPTLVWPFASVAISATALYYPASQGDSEAPVALFQPSYVKISNVPSMGKQSIAFTVENNASLNFLLDRQMARTIIDALTALLDAPALTAT